jgi:putative lipase involved disintegration of autophagic bodies
MKLLLTIYIAGVLYNLCYIILYFSDDEFNIIAKKNNFFTFQDKVKLLLKCFLSWGIQLYYYLNKIK